MLPEHYVGRSAISRRLIAIVISCKPIVRHFAIRSCSVKGDLFAMLPILRGTETGD